MSTRTVVYKGLLLAHQVGSFYKDLTDPRTESALALAPQPQELAFAHAGGNLHVVSVRANDLPGAPTLRA